jgi:hypothetical protein
VYVAAYKFEGLAHGDSFADMSVRGRKMVVGIAVTPYGDPDNSYKADCLGTIRLFDTDEGFTAAAGTPNIEFPVKYHGSWGAANFALLSDADGYVLFENGLSIESTTATGQEDPLKSTSVDIFYV